MTPLLKELLLVAKQHRIMLEEIHAIANNQSYHPEYAMEQIRKIFKPTENETEKEKASV